MKLLTPHAIVRRRFKDFVLDPYDSSPSNVYMLAKRENFANRVIHDYYNLPLAHYFTKYCSSSRFKVIDLNIQYIHLDSQCACNVIMSLAQKLKQKIQYKSIN